MLKSLNKTLKDLNSMRSCSRLVLSGVQVLRFFVWALYSGTARFNTAINETMVRCSRTYCAAKDVRF